MGSTPALSNSFSTFYSTLNKQLLVICSNGSVINKKLAVNETFWDWMSETIEHFNQRMGNLRILHDDGTLQDVKEHKIPFDFRLGMVGYFGYEMKRESLPNYTISTDQYSNVPDSAFIFTTQAIIFDHLEKQMWLAGLVRLPDKIEVDYVGNNLGIHPGLSYVDYLSWTKSIEKQLHNFDNLMSSSKQTPLKKDIRNEGTSFTPVMKQDDYIKAIEKARSYIHEGQSYELCLTTQFRADLADLPKKLDDNWVELYQCIRSFNPAPFSALLSFPTKDIDICIMSSSPEKFLQIDNEGVMEMKPIKGTVARARECCCLNLKECDKGTLCESRRKEEDMKRARLLEEDIKERSENLMVKL
jgi:para-aminobenzoate synthetase